jgi:hypothetical protein
MNQNESDQFAAIFNITLCIKVGGVGEIAATVAGGKYGARRRMATFVAQCAAVGLWSAAVLARIRRDQMSDLPLRDFRHCRHKMRKEQSVSQSKRDSEQQRKQKST